ncbi:MAG: dihydroorotase family protein [Candidatus Cloacimonadaceae bacterium]
MKKVLQGGLVWQDTGFAKLDLVTENGVIIQVGEKLFFPEEEIIDCRDSFLLPAVCDAHVHIGEKVCGLNLADDWQSLSKLAEKCGVAAIGAFLTEASSSEEEEKILSMQYEEAKEKAQKEFCGKVHWHLTPKNSEVKDILPLLENNCDLKFYTTYKENGLYRSYEEIERWMEELSDLQPTIFVHCEDDKIIAKYSEANPFHHPFDCTLRRPESAEIKAVERILDLSVKHNYPVHIVHVSSPKSVLLINEARTSAPVTCETAPQYLLLNDSYLQRSDGHRWLCTPPLRNENSRGLLVELLQDGLIDIVATDHCPFTKEDKDKYKDNLEQVPSGLAGMGVTFPLLYEQLVHPDIITLDSLIALLSINPARLLNIYPSFGSLGKGSKADIIILKREPASKPIPVIPSFANTYNPWQDFTHHADFTFFRG